MRYFLKSCFAFPLVAAVLPAFAQDAKIIEDPYARATPAGAMTGAVYMTIDNKASAPDRLTGAASNVAAKI